MSGRSPISTRWGSCVYEMLTGELPFTGDSAVEIAMKQVSDPPPSIRKQNRLVSEGLEQVVMRALSKDPALRHHSARQMAEELRRVSHGGAVSSDTQMATRVLTGGAAAAAAYTGAQTSVIPPGGTKPPPERESPRRSALPWLLVLVLLMVSAAVGYVVYKQLSGSGVDVPTLSGSCQTAKAQLAAAQLKGTCQDKESSLARKGLVVGSDPTRRIERRQELDRHDLHRRGPERDHRPGRPWQVRLARRPASSRARDSRSIRRRSTSTRRRSARVAWSGRLRRPGSQEPQGTTIQLRVATGNVVVPDVIGPELR